MTSPSNLACGKETEEWKGENDADREDDGGSEAG